MNSQLHDSAKAVTIEDLLGALVEWQICRDAMNRCYNSCDTSPDYFCSRESEGEHNARDKFGAMLTELIDARIEAATGARP